MKLKQVQHHATGGTRAEDHQHRSRNLIFWRWFPSPLGQPILLLLLPLLPLSISIVSLPPVPQTFFSVKRNIHFDLYPPFPSPHPSSYLYLSLFTLSSLYVSLYLSLSSLSLLCMSLSFSLSLPMALSISPNFSLCSNGMYLIHMHALSPAINDHQA